MREYPDTLLDPGQCSLLIMDARPTDVFQRRRGLPKYRHVTPTGTCQDGKIIPSSLHFEYGNGNRFCRTVIFRRARSVSANGTH